MPQKLRNELVKITSSNNNQFVDVYTPSTIDGHALDGAIVEFFLTVELKSIAALIEPPLPEGSGLMTREELQQDFRAKTTDAPSKVISFYYEKNGVSIPATAVQCFRQDPFYQEEMLQYISSKNRLGIQNGVKIKARVEDFGSGLLASGDVISIFLVIEESKLLEITDYKQLFEV